MILRQGNTLYLSVDTDNIFMQWNVPLIDEIIIDMSSCLLAVAMVTYRGSHGKQTVWAVF